jgi:hypothetical protein
MQADQNSQIGASSPSMADPPPDADVLAMAQEFGNHLDRYEPTELFVCIFCSFDDPNPVPLLAHLRTAHSFTLTDLRRIPLLPKYLDYWRIHAPHLIPSSTSGLATIDPDDPQEQQLRASLHGLRLEAVMQEHEAERTVPQAALPCLFCPELFDGTWHDYLQWLFEKHQFNPGRPSNLVFIPQMVQCLRDELDNNICMFCKAVFPNQRKLRSHLRKKRHMRIPSDRAFDRFYMVNYLELDRQWEEDAEEEDDLDEMEALEVAAADFDEIEENETVCLVCDSALPTPEEAVAHLRALHGFEIREVRAALDRDFYDSVRFVNYARLMKSQNRCFVCGADVAGDYAEHVEAHESKVPVDLGQIRGDDRLLIPFFDEDPLLTELEND